MANGNVATEYAATYTSFSGCDIVCTFGNVVIGELQAISYSVQREKAPVYTMGSAEPRSFSRGKRGIAGTLVFTVFDRDALIGALQGVIEQNKSFQRIGGERNMQAMTIDNWDKQMTDLAMGTAKDNSNGSSTVSISGAASTNSEGVTRNVISSTATVHYDDEVPPFDVTISFANEYGQMATLVIYGVEILNEQTTFSIDSVVTEKACTFVARKVEHMRSVSKTGAAATEKAQANSNDGVTNPTGGATQV